MKLEEVVDHWVGFANYWANTPLDRPEFRKEVARDGEDLYRAEGVVFSILSVLDGDMWDIPGMEIIPRVNNCFNHRWTAQPLMWPLHERWSMRHYLRIVDFDQLAATSFTVEDMTDIFLYELHKIARIPRKLNFFFFSELPKDMFPEHKLLAVVNDVLVLLRSGVYAGLLDIPSFDITPHTRRR